MRLDQTQIIGLLLPADHQSAGSDLDSLNMGLLHEVRIILALGAVTGDNPILLLYAGATAGTKTTELAFKYRKSSVDVGTTGSDTFGARTAQAVDGTGLALGTAANADNRMWVIDVQSDEMPEGKKWLTLALDDGSASALFATAIAVAMPRYIGDTVTTAV